MSQLRLINQTEITSSVASVSVTDIFTSDYDIYKISADITSSGGDSDGSLQFLNPSGSAITSSNYAWAMLIMKSNTSFVDYKNTGTTQLDALFHGTPQGSGNIVYIFNPYSSSRFTFAIAKTIGQSSSNLRAYGGTGVLKLTDSISGFKLSFDVNATSGKIKTYGLRVD